MCKITTQSRSKATLLLPLAGLAVSILLAGCTVGPNYRRPTVETPTGWKETPPDDWKTATPSDDISKGNWWEIFGDPQLNNFEMQALAANQTLKAAADNVLVARATAKVTRSQQFPQVSALPSITSQRESGNRPTQPGATVVPYVSNQFYFPVSASYEADLFGAVRRSVESANAQTQAAIASYENTLLILKSDVAEYYIMVRYIDLEMVILRNNIDLQQRALDLTMSRRAGGVASGLDVSEAESLLETTQASYIALGVQRAQFEHALAVLLGKPPEEFDMAANPLTLQPPVVPTGMPSDLLERRPDVADAERTMASSNAVIGVAKAAYYPTVILSGGVGALSGNLSNILNVPSLVWSVGANAAQPIFNGGALAGNLAKARANYDESVADYRQTVLTAFQQVEDGISGLRVLEQEAAVTDQAVRAAQQTVDISTQRYTGGLEEYLDVITAQVNLLTDQRSADAILEQRLLTTVSLIEALGGGWQPSTIYSPSAVGPGRVPPHTVSAQQP